MGFAVEDIYAPSWFSSFDSRGRLNPGAAMKVECQICTKKLAVTKRPDSKHETFTMLPCGHVFGYKCVKHWLEQADRPNCPQCRTKMVYACGCQVRPTEMRGGPSFNPHSKLPPVLLDAGGDLPRCPRCMETAARQEREGKAVSKSPEYGNFEDESSEDEDSSSYESEGEIVGYLRFQEQSPSQLLSQSQSLSLSESQLYPYSSREPPVQSHSSYYHHHEHNHYVHSHGSSEPCHCQFGRGSRHGSYGSNRVSTGDGAPPCVPQ
ncbi:hypothetical protein F4777DRAFT_583136 [Nemania sp. FL0916]|nr:hypothetical protein F4777DRAFT_583136 [Nemania sp. FL0916]